MRVRTGESSKGKIARAWQWFTDYWVGLLIVSIVAFGITMVAIDPNPRDAGDVRASLLTGMSSYQVETNTAGEVAAEARCEAEKVSEHGHGTYLCDVRLVNDSAWHEYRVKYTVEGYDQWSSVRLS